MMLMIIPWQSHETSQFIWVVLILKSMNISWKSQVLLIYLGNFHDNSMKIPGKFHDVVVSFCLSMRRMVTCVMMVSWRSPHRCTSCHPMTLQAIFGHVSEIGEFILGDFTLIISLWYVSEIDFTFRSSIFWGTLLCDTWWVRTGSETAGTYPYPRLDATLEPQK